MTVATLPGATLWHEGEFEGWRVHVPVLLGRRPVEPVDHDLREFHLRLLAAAVEVRHGSWERCEATGWPDNSSWVNLLCWSWIAGDGRCLIVVNDADTPAATRVHLPWHDVGGRAWQLRDLMSGDVFTRQGDELASSGLFVQLPPWGFHVLTWSSIGDAA